MEINEIVARLTPIARMVFEQPELELTDDLSAETLDSWNSLRFMQLLQAVEQEFGFRFKMMELISIKTMGDMVETIAKHC